MGFRPDMGPAAFTNELATLSRHYIRWNEIENAHSDGVDRIRSFCNNRWKGVAGANIKIIPRVYLHWSADTEIPDTPQHRRRDGPWQCLRPP